MTYIFRRCCVNHQENEGDRNKRRLFVGLALRKVQSNKEASAYGKEDSVSSTKLEGLQSQFD
jgi:hypothetical protein